MKRSVELVLTPAEAFDPERLDQAVREKLGASLATEGAYRIVKRSIDARSRNVVVRLLCELGSPGSLTGVRNPVVPLPDVSKGKAVLVVGAGPAGLFAALRLIELGIKPVVLERGKDVQARRRDIAAINKEHVVNPESNYCFGEGGAGTYSDGKLYTRSTKRGDVQRILDILVAHGAPEEILFDAHPHIGTNKLPLVVKALRESILAAGGEVRFNTRVTDFILAGEEIKGVITMDGGRMEGEAVILATGHSARDIYTLLAKRNILIEAKSFAMGIRVEHPQSLIDGVQYHTSDRGLLPAASYSLVHQATWDKKARGVFSFCMCPGGFIVPAATAQDEVVVNGMSPSRRDSRFANSGIVVALDPADIQRISNRPAADDRRPATDDQLTHRSSLAGMHFQREIEMKACLMGGNTQSAPAQRLMDFIERRSSSSLPACSYQPGLVAADVGALFPEFIAGSLRVAFQEFGKKMKGYLTNDAVVVGVESRTSSPVRIPRNPETFEHVQIRNLYPCAEGAGYAGGIVSAAMDGENCATACSMSILKRRAND